MTLKNHNIRFIISFCLLYANSSKVASNRRKIGLHETYVSICLSISWLSCEFTYSFCYMTENRLRGTFSPHWSNRSRFYKSANKASRKAPCFLHDILAPRCIAIPEKKDKKKTLKKEEMIICIVHTRKSVRECSLRDNFARTKNYHNYMYIWMDIDICVACDVVVVYVRFF